MLAFEFLAKVAEAIEHEDALTAEQELGELPTWDSLGILNVLSLFEEMGINAEIDAINDAKLASDLIALAGEKVVS